MMHIIYGIALLYLAVEAFSWVSFVPDGVLEYLVLVVGVLMVLTPLEAGSMKAARKLRGLPGPKMFGIIPTGIVFKVLGFIVIALGVATTIGTVGEFIGLTLYSASGKWVLFGIGAIYLLSTSTAGNTNLGSL